MKILLLIAATAFTVAIAADTKQPAVPVQTNLTIEEHSDLLLALAQSLSDQLQESRLLVQGKLGVDARNASEAAQKAYLDKLAALRISHNAIPACLIQQQQIDNQWDFKGKKWICPAIVAESDKKK